MSINKTLSFCFLIISLLLIVNLFRDVQRLIQAEERIVKTEERLVQVKQENEEFKKEKEYYQSEAFLEEQIRTKLQMAKPGETVLILPETIKEEKEGNEQQNREDEKKRANWQKWLALFK
jgi:cell division protein FtsB